MHPRVFADAVSEARVHLAAAYRMAVLHGLDEGIDNHFTMTMPGRQRQYLILPFGWHWSEASANKLIVFDADGRTLDGVGQVELTAQCIHAPIHCVTGAKVVLHTHQTWATSLNLLQDNRLQPASQTAGFIQHLLAYDDEYAGAANSTEEGMRLARLMEGKSIVFLRNHGVLVTGDTVAEAYQRLYRLERVCRTQILAMSTGKALQLVPYEHLAQLASGRDERHPRQLRQRMFFDAMMRVLDRELPGYAE